VKDLRSLWVSDIPSDVSLETLSGIFEDELGLSAVRAREHAANLGSGSVARIYSDDPKELARMRLIFGRLGCRFEEALESQAS
jgi:hypothetical protein